jgi:hypothetical protein
MNSFEAFERHPAPFILLVERARLAHSAAARNSASCEPTAAASCMSLSILSDVERRMVGGSTTFAANSGP